MLYSSVSFSIFTDYAARRANGMVTEVELQEPEFELSG